MEFFSMKFLVIFISEIAAQNQQKELRLPSSVISE